MRTPREGGTDQDGAGATASYFKIPVFAQPCTFAFDMSGSMREAVSRDNPKLRVDVAREELARTLKQLPEGTPFNIVIYRYYSEFPPQTEVQRAFAKGVQPLSARNAESAVNWLAGLKALGWGALYENLAAAVEDPEPQVIYFLSDGAPSRGEYVDRDEMVAAVAELRRFRPLVIHCVLVGGGNRDVEFMTALAASSAGRMADARK
ncbi:MAG: hypothetical protein IT463_07290 [Planctomycetes bacterium]|nr:hypothetical protein [Planctomycetota bacterium]